MRSAPDGVEERLIAATILQMLQAIAARKQIQPDVQDMIRFIVWQMQLEQFERAIDLASHVQSLDHLHDDTDSARCDRLLPVGQFILDSWGSEHRRPARPMPLVDSIL